jgi:hypothetical protein
MLVEKSVFEEGSFVVVYKQRGLATTIATQSVCLVNLLVSVC